MGDEAETKEAEKAEKAKAVGLKRPMVLNPELSSVKHVVVVMSGKGGVGKTTVAVNVAVALAMRGKKVGILDADLHGPNVPRMMGVEGERILANENGKMVPVETKYGVKVASIGFLLEDQSTPVIWRGPLKTGAIKQLLGEVEWGDLDYLIIDLPPGTGDEPLSVAQQVPRSDGAIVVTTPQEVSLLDVRKAINFARSLKMEVLGVVENMSGLICPHCGKEIDLFKKGGGKKVAEEMGVPFLGEIPIEPDAVEGGDIGVPPVTLPESGIARAFNSIVERLLEMVEKTG